MPEAGDKRQGDQEMNAKRLKGAQGFGLEEGEEREREREEAEANIASSGGGNSNSHRGGSADFQQHSRGPGTRDRPSFNHYSSKPQLYNANLPFHMHGINMYPPPPPPPPPNSQQQPQQQGLLQPPPPPPPPPQHHPHQHQYPYYAPQGQYQYSPYWMMPQ
ncbi:hypothetical protein C0J52_25042 [Blattella germanica]|nr:hypothetical protein C0J52_25042 [Blattella germanica]